MPGSAISSQGTGSQLSNGSRRGRTRQYHTVSHTSQIDESLFGAPHRVTERQTMLDEMWENGEVDIEQLARERSAKRLRGKNGKNGKKNKETVQVITKDLIRNLIVPQDDPSGQSCILSYSEYARLAEASRVLTDEERKQRIVDLKAQRETLMQAVQEQKQQMKMLDLQRKKNAQLTDLEQEDEETREAMKAKAGELREEQEDEIKKLNELILNAKCHAIRDAQILEKGQIKREMVDEEKRLDLMMEADRQNALVIEHEIDRKRKEERSIGAMKIMEQIQGNEQERLLDLERKDRENRQQQLYLDKLCEEEADKLHKKRHEQQALREELNKCNSDIIRRKEIISEQEHLEEEKVLDYQREKSEREAAYEAEQERIRIEKEKEVAKLRAQQERARDEQAESDALRAKRAGEQAERDWRKKEAEEVRRKQETEEHLKVARAQQMAQKEHFLAVQAQRERAEFERVLGAQYELVEKEKREEDEKAKKLVNYADEVRSQIRNKESVRIHERQEYFREGIKLDEEAKARRQRIDTIKKKKLDDLKHCGISDRYVNEVARKANVTVQAT